MKQANNPKMPEIANKIVNSSDLTEEEMIAQLEKSSKGSILLSAQKKEFLMSLLRNKAELLEECSAFDSVMDGGLYNGISKLLPANTRVVTHDSKNVDLAGMISKFLKPLKILHSYVEKQYEIEKERKLQLRSSTQDQQKRSPVKVILDDAVDIYSKLELAIMDVRSVPTNSSVGKSQVKLTTLQRQRKWDQERVPVAKQLQFCANCGHKSTNLPVENDEIQQYNKRKADEHSKSAKLWDEYMKKVANGDKNAHKPTNMSRRPNKRNFREPIIICMCATSFCLGNFDTTKNSCPIKCLKSEEFTNETQVKVEGKAKIQEKGEKYEFVGSPKACSCPICACHCRFACKIADVPSILIQKTIQKTAAVGSGVAAKDPFYDQSVPGEHFLQNAMKGAMKMCWKTWNEEQKNQKLDLYNLDPKLYDRIENRGVTAGCHNSAVNIVTSSPNLTLKQRMKWREGLGKPTSKVCLPSGDIFNTKVIATNEKHSDNNKLGANKIQNENFPGMKGNLKIDYSNQCESYTDFIQGKTNNSIKTPWEKKLMKKYGRNCDEAILVDDSSTSDCSDVIIVDASKANEDRNDLARKMHKRIVTRSRSLLTRKIKESMNGDDDDKSIKSTKAEIRKLKQMIQLLESSELSNTHLNIIKSVTDDGKDLINDDSSVTSNDVIDRLQVYHEIE